MDISKYQVDACSKLYFTDFLNYRSGCYVIKSSIKNNDYDSYYALS